MKIQVEFKVFNFSISKVSQKKMVIKFMRKSRLKQKRTPPFLFEMNEIPKVRDFFSSWF